MTVTTPDLGDEPNLVFLLVIFGNFTQIFFGWLV